MGGRRVNAERVLAAKRRKRQQVVTWSFIIIALLFTAILVYTFLFPPQPYKAFAMCLAEKGVVMYGSDWCSHCQAQKRRFGTAFKYVVYENCDYSKACQEQNITGLPTWILPDGTRLVGEQPLTLLAEKSGCPLKK